MSSIVNTVFGAFILVTLQGLAALPWLLALDKSLLLGRGGSPLGQIGRLLGVYFAASAVVSVFGLLNRASSGLELVGTIYGLVLQVQLLLDLFIYAPRLLALVFPKTGAVALATYREGWRQPMFWFILAGGKLAMWGSVALPYFTLGDDYKMMKHIEFDIIMMAAVLFGVLSAGIGIHEEIEGRTAITVMSKPINRRSFLIGKYLGILMACAAMSLVLAVSLNLTLMAKPEFDPINKDRAYDPMPEQGKAAFSKGFQAIIPSGPAKQVADGAGRWMGESFAHSFGVLLGFGQVMILVAIAAALATRVSFVISLIVVVFIYLVGHLAPVVVEVTKNAPKDSTAATLVYFVAQAFNVVLPALEFFNMGPAVIRDTKLDLWQFAGYSLTVFGYSTLYTLIALLVGLLLFEDRDLP